MNAKMNGILIHPDDNVAVALKDLTAGEELYADSRNRVAVSTAIPSGHKIALKDMATGETVVKYGHPIGHLVRPVKAGDRVDETVLKTDLQGITRYEYHPVVPIPDRDMEKRTFKGYLRKNGQCGIRNEIWIVPTVGCVNGIAAKLASRLIERTGGRNVDGIRAFGHPYGCSQLGTDLENTRKILRDLILHPNAGGVLVIGLGCENNQLDALKKTLGDFNPSRIRFLVCQEVEDEEKVGMEMLLQLYEVTGKDRRTDLPVSLLNIGLKCGGSDGFSGITANPLLGAFSDYWAAQGGCTVMTEVPEMFGAESLLMDRCCNRRIFEKAVRLINGFKSYFIENKQEIYENPSPGNKKGGLSTLEEKSLGCTQKSGSSPIRDVLSYGERITERGLNLLSAPGNDLVASTALAASGCHLILFTTGRGTPFGSFVPTVKISSNSPLFRKKKNWIDFNAGSVLEGVPREELLKLFIDYVIDVASGTKTKNEMNGYAEIAIFKTGITL